MKQGTKKKTGLARLWELAAVKKGLVIHYAGMENLDRVYMIRLGWIACGGAVGAVFLNFCALMCSHFAAFTTLYRLKLDFTRHIASLPLGFHTANSSGKLRKITDENIEKLEGFIAHQLPDLAGSFAMPVITLIILFFFTVIIIAHRLSTVRGADKILVIEKGRLVEQGRHETLAAAGGLYQRMWEQYSSAMNWGIGRS
jgi:ABC-type multidrug transport system fused ATPase/permease subunit